MQNIPEIVCPECGMLMEYEGHLNGTALITVRCPRDRCHHERTLMPESHSADIKPQFAFQLKPAAK